MTFLRMLNLFTKYISFFLISGLEAFCILLRRLAYPNRLVDLEEKFGRAKSSLSSISNTVLDIVFANKSHLLHDLRNLNWLTEVRLRQYAAAVGAMCPVQNCWGFIDGTARPICRPSQRQEEYYSGHKRVHCVKYQSVVCPDGIIASMMGPYQGSRHDAGILRDTNLYEQLEIKTRFSVENKFVLYGDAAYPIRELLLKPYQTRALVPVEANFNYEMSRARQAVEWGFGKIISEFAFVDFKKNQKLLLQQIGKMYTVATLLTNCHTCLYQGQTSSYFDIQPPSIEEYLQ